MKILLQLSLIIIVFISCSDKKNTSTDENKANQQNNPEKEKTKLILRTVNNCYQNSDKVRAKIDQDTMLLHDDYQKLRLYQEIMGNTQLVLQIFIENDLANMDSLLNKAKSYNDKEINQLVIENQKVIKKYLETDSIFRAHK